MLGGVQCQGVLLSREGLGEGEGSLLGEVEETGALWERRDPMECSAPEAVMTPVQKDARRHIRGMGSSLSSQKGVGQI